MKNRIIKTFGQITLVALVFLVISAFTNSKTTTAISETQSFTVIVNYKSGSPAESIKINYDVCSTISCAGGGENQYTDKNGKATIEWTSGCAICWVYIDGTAHKGEYKDGGTYTFILE